MLIRFRFWSAAVFEQIEADVVGHHLLWMQNFLSYIKVEHVGFNRRCLILPYGFHKFGDDGLEDQPSINPPVS